MVDLEVVNLIMLGVFGVIILLSTLVGASRGYKKSGFRLLWVTITFLVLFFFSGKITTWLVQLQLPFSIDMSGTTCSSVMDMILALIYQIPYASQVLTEAPFLSELIVTIPVMFVSVFVFTILFWVIKWVLWPIWAIISGITCKYYKISYHEGKKLKLKTKKHKLLGAGFGLVMGYLVAIVSFTPFIGYSKMINLVESETEDETTGKGILSNVMGDNIKYIYTYEDGFMKKIATYTGLDALSNLCFTSLSSAQIGGSTVTMENEIKVLSQVASYAMPLTKYDYTNLSKDDIDDIAETMTNLINKVFGSGLITGTSQEVLDYFTNAIVEDPTIIEPYLSVDDNTFTAIVDMCEALQDVKMSDLKVDLLNLVEVVKILNSSDMVIPLIKNEITLENYKEYVSVTAVNSAIDKVLSGTVMKKSTPVLINLGVNYLCDYVGAVYQKSNIDMSKISSALKTLVSGAYDSIDQVYVGGSWNFSDIESPMTTLGNVVDYLDSANTLSTSTKRSLLGVAKNYALDYLDTMGDNVAQYKETVGVCLDELVVAYTSNAGGWKKEFKAFSKVYDLAFDYFKTTNYADYDLAKIGSYLDILGGTKLFGSCADNIINMGLDYVEEFATNSGKTLEISYLCDSIINVSTDSTMNYESELSKLQGLYDLAISNVGSVTGGTLLDDITTGTLLTDIGHELDSITSGTNKSKIFTLSVVKDLLRQGINTLDTSVLPSQIQNITIDDKNIVEALASNVAGITSFETELSYVKDIINLDFNSITMSDLGAKLDIYKSSKLLGSLIVPMAKEIVNDFTLPDMVKDIMVGDKTINEAIIDNLSQVTSWENDLSVIDTLSDITDDNIGATLDTLKTTKLIGNDIVCAIVKDQITKTDLSQNFDADTSTKIKDKIISNINNVLSWTAEMSYVKKLTNIDMDNVDATFTEIEDSILLSGVVDIVAEYKINETEIPDTVVSASASSLVKEKMISNIPSVTDWGAEINLIDSLTTITDSNKGQVLDSMNESKLFSGVAKIIVTDVIENATLPNKFDGLIIGQNTVKQTMILNIDSIVSYADEIGYLDQVNTITDENIGSVLDSVKVSKLLSGVLGAVVEQEIDNMSTDIDNAQVITLMKSNLYDTNEEFNTAINFTNEITSIKKLSNISSATNAEIGALLDEVSSTVIVGISGTNLLLKDAINNMSVQDKYSTILSSIVSNVDNITAQNATNDIYTTEITILDRLATEMNKTDGSGDFSFILDKDATGTILDSSGNSTSLLVTNEIIDKIENLII